MRSSQVSRADDAPNQLSLISKKSGYSPQKVKSRSGERSLAHTQTQQTDNILDQMNVMSILGTQASGYHQLEPKLFPTAKHDFERGKQRESAVPSETEISRNTASRNNTRTKMTSKKSRDSQHTRERVASPEAHSYFEDDEMGYVSHNAIEGRLQGNRTNKQLA